MSSNPPVLDYGNGRGQTATDSPWLALLLCAPGAACFAMYFFNVGGFGLFFGMLLAAILTALVSLVLYGGHPRRALRWYVLLNLAINVSGLLFAAVGPIGMPGEVWVRLARRAQFLSEERWSDVVGVLAACVILPVIACLCAKFMSDAMPQSIPAQIVVYGFMMGGGPLILWVAELIASITDRIGWTNSGSSLWFAFAGSLWTVVMCGTPYLYLRRRLRRERRR